MTGTRMAAEMAEQPEVLARLIEHFEDHVARVRAILPERLVGIVFVARGSSDHAALFGRYLIEMAASRPAGLIAPSLYTLYSAHVNYDGYLAIALSQSGATPEIVSVCEQLRSSGARVVVITNNATSPLTTCADVVIALDAGEERAVPATKTVTVEFLAVAAVAAALGPVPFTHADLVTLPENVSLLLANETAPKKLAERWSEANHLVVVARGLLYGVALEAALKIKETAGVLAEGFSAADIRHGPIAALNTHVPVLLLDGGGPVSSDLADLGDVLAQRQIPTARCAADRAAELPLPAQVPEALMTILALVRAQQFALALALLHGRNPDAPTGLLKVTPTH